MPKYPIIHDYEQGSDEWLKLKLCKVSASHFKDVLSKKPGRLLYMRRLVGELQTQQQAKVFCGDYMKDGTEKEPAARALYSEINHVEVKQIGFYQMSEFVGCSPDGLIDIDGGLEIKSPIPSTHLRYIQENRCPTNYVPQVQGSIYVTGRKWWDFVSFCPEVKGGRGSKIWCKKILRDGEYINETLAPAVEKFVKELKEMIEFFNVDF